MESPSRLRPGILATGGCCLGALLLAGCDGVGHAGIAEDRPSPEPAAAVEEVELAVFMGELQRHAAKLGFAVEGRNERLAAFYLEEVEEVLDELAEVEEVEGFPIGSTERTIMPPLVEALAAELGAGDWPAASVSYRSLIDGCNRCHAATEHEYIVILPAEGPPPFNQRFHGP